MLATVGMPLSSFVAALQDFATALDLVDIKEVRVVLGAALGCFD
jgi:hypothetical protein